MTLRAVIDRLFAHHSLTPKHAIATAEQMLQGGAGGLPSDLTPDEFTGLHKWGAKVLADALADLSTRAPGTGRGSAAYQVGSALAPLVRYGIMREADVQQLALYDGSDGRDTSRGLAEGNNFAWLEVRRMRSKPDVAAMVAMCAQLPAALRQLRTEVVEFAQGPAPAEPEQPPPNVPWARWRLQVLGQIMLLGREDGYMTKEKADGTVSVLADCIDNTAHTMHLLGERMRRNLWTGDIETASDADPRWKPITDDWRATLRAAGSQKGYRLSHAASGDHVRDLARCFAIDPMLAFFNGLQDSDTEGLTLDTWLPAVLGIEPTPYHCAVGRYMLGAIVCRAAFPGIKMDEMPVLVGVQHGQGKSTLVELLAPWPDAYTDSVQLGDDDKHMLEQTRGVLVVEVSELAQRGGRQIEHVKRQLSKKKDSARLAYAYDRTDVPRRFFMIGTTNDDKPLSDPTGNRRFLPVVIPPGAPIDLPRLQRVRDALYRLVVRELAAGASPQSFRLPPELWAEAAAVQEAARSRPAWEDELRELLTSDAAPDSAECFLPSAALAAFAQARRIYSVQALAPALRDMGFFSTRVYVGQTRTRGWRRKTNVNTLRRVIFTATKDGGLIAGEALISPEERAEALNLSVIR